MGLDISAYSQIKLTLDTTYVGEDDVDYDRLEDECSKPNHTHVCHNSHYLGHADGLKNGIYSYKESFGFRAGSYSGYNHWRNELAKFAGYESAEYVWDQCNSNPDFSGAFVELINFSDCEGVIGPKTSAKLLKDFDAFVDKIPEVTNRFDYFSSFYKEWHEAFKLAVDNGCIEFG